MRGTMDYVFTKGLFCKRFDLICVEIRTWSGLLKERVKMPMSVTFVFGRQWKGIAEMNGRLR